MLWEGGHIIIFVISGILIIFISVLLGFHCYISCCVNMTTLDWIFYDSEELEDRKSRQSRLSHMRNLETERSFQKKWILYFYATHKDKVKQLLNHHWRTSELLECTSRFLLFPTFQILGLHLLFHFTPKFSACPMAFPNASKCNCLHVCYGFCIWSVFRWWFPHRELPAVLRGQLSY